MLADLHMHTTFSDGVNTPEELVREAEKAHLCAMAITDHDNTLAYDEAKKVIDARQDGIHLIRRQDAGGAAAHVEGAGPQMVFPHHFSPSPDLRDQGLYIGLHLPSQFSSRPLPGTAAEGWNGS